MISLEITGGSGAATTYIAEHVVAISPHHSGVFLLPPIPPVFQLSKALPLLVAFPEYCRPSCLCTNFEGVLFKTIFYFLEQY